MSFWGHKNAHWTLNAQSAPYVAKCVQSFYILFFIVFKLLFICVWHFFQYFFAFCVTGGILLVYFWSWKLKVLCRRPQEVGKKTQNEKISCFCKFYILYKEFTHGVDFGWCIVWWKGGEGIKSTAKSVWKCNHLHMLTRANFVSVGGACVYTHLLSSIFRMNERESVDSKRKISKLSVCLLIAVSRWFRLHPGKRWTIFVHIRNCVHISRALTGEWLALSTSMSLFVLFFLNYSLVQG